ncbi:copper amine oxidase [Exophiala viscosa]|uniref:Amine oxidase n=1 Tax=Exophiala viscosa TaxID=2486360 RepID=A0AAN6IBF5_9EURO|nr:copper amine oxidase [Exophiala viscosa]KAI1623794.1 copper amine oxidase [Exophiala viscosa]
MMASWRPMGIVVSALIIFSSIAYLLLSLTFIHPIRHQHTTAASSSHFRAPAINPFAELDGAEASQIYTFLHQTPNSLNLSTDTRGGNQIYLIELLRPNKTDAVEYLESHKARPDRWARVSSLEIHDDDAFIVDYMVGPLPPSNDTQILPLEYNHNSGRNYVQSPVSDVFAMLDWALSIGENASDITQELLGATTNRDDLDDPDVLVIGCRPSFLHAGRTVQWLEFFGSGMDSDSRSILPQGLYVKLDIPGANPATWTTGQWFYNGILYDNETALREAIKSPDFVKLELNQDGSWSDTEDFETSFPERDMPPPLSIQPYGPRYHLDRKEGFISWMGFSFYLATAQATALSLFDIRYNNTRMIYELGLQEALAHYAGVEPLQSGLEFLDTFFGMGSMMFSLVPGVDCPGHAEYLDMSYHKGGKMYTNRNAICIFEYTSDAPLQRHTSTFSATVSRNTYLVVRSVSTVGNYDYTIDYIFYLDGSIEVKLRASGYIFGAFHAEPRGHPEPHDGHTNEYGYRIHDALHTSMHDHVVNFKADMDICGTSNTLVRTSIEPLQRTYDWDKPEVSGVRNTMHMVHKSVTHETGLNWPSNSHDMYLVTAPGSVNKWGETRAYRIQPGTGMGNPAHLTILNSTTLGRSALWSANDLWVLKNHPDNEPASAHHLNYLAPLEPLVDFEAMVDGEEIEEEDLVVYFNLGSHHVPSSQDIPNTLMHTSASSVMFVPFNYFDYDVSRAMRQGVRIDRRREAGKSMSKNDGSDKEEVRKSRVARAENENKDDEGVKYFGARYEGPVTVSEKMLSPDLSHYMKERLDGQWKAVRNSVGGGLPGLFVGKERAEDDGGRRLDW